MHTDDEQREKGVVEKCERPKAALGVDHSMLYSIQTLAAPRARGTRGDVGDRMAKPRNMKVRINVARSGRSFAKT